MFNRAPANQRTRSQIRRVDSFGSRMVSPLCLKGASREALGSNIDSPHFWWAGSGRPQRQLHATTDDLALCPLLALLGLDHEALTYRHAGRDFRLTDVEGRIVREIIA